MSADPDSPVDANRTTGGYVIKNMIYGHTSGGNFEVQNSWNFMSVRELNQSRVPPSSFDMHQRHPCIALNRALLQCAESCEKGAKLAARISECNDERQRMMQCMVKARGWVAPPDPWYKIW